MRRTVLAVVIALALVALAAVVVVRGGLSRADCTVAGVELDRDQAMALTSGVAEAQRTGTPPRAALTALVRSGDLDAEDASPLLAALTSRPTDGREGLSCRVGSSDDRTTQAIGKNGLTPAADAVLADVRGRFGRLPVGGFAPGGVSTGHQRGSAHYEGRAVDVFFRPISANNKAAGWLLAQYLVAHAERLSVQTVIFDGRIWSRGRSTQGWRSYEIDTGDAPRRTRQILEHRDHVHVDVTR